MTLVLIVLSVLVAFNADDLPFIGGGTTYSAYFARVRGAAAGQRGAGRRGQGRRRCARSSWPRNKVLVDFRVKDVEPR